ncbi:hypothetical protein [Methanoculleus oceani]|uniref:hypothetical protein n=1 Tax=Methanoculleus oceani TaxID=2184756 RepID=UPI0020333FF3|nr:hypothetical protein [Methanoculleus sp. CWC-02]
MRKRAAFSSCDWWRAEGCDCRNGRSLRRAKAFEPELEKTRSVFEQRRSVVAGRRNR